MLLVHVKKEKDTFKYEVFLMGQKIMNGECAKFIIKKFVANGEIMNTFNVKGSSEEFEGWFASIGVYKGLDVVEGVVTLVILQ